MPRNRSPVGARSPAFLEPRTIGKNVSSGCIRMVNQDVIDLYNRVAIGTVVKVI